MALNHKLQTFVDVYDGDANKAADIAGISQQYGRALMMSLASPFSKPKAKEVQLAIRQRDEPAETTRTTVIHREIDSRLDRQEFWTSVRKDKKQKMSDRLQASLLMGKSQADFIDVQANVDQMRLQLGAPRRRVEATTLPDAPVEAITGDVDGSDDV